MNREIRKSVPRARIFLEALLIYFSSLRFISGESLIMVLLIFL